MDGPRTLCYHLWRGHCVEPCSVCLAFYGPDTGERKGRVATDNNLSS